MRLNFKVIGEGEPLIVLHGFLGSLDNWQSLATALSSQYKVYLVDLRNHGKSEHTTQHNYSLMCDDLLEFFEENKIEKATLLGHSMGGKTAQFFAVKNPQKIEKLIVVDIGTKYYPPHHQLVLHALNAVSLLEVKSRQEIEQQLQKHLTDNGLVQWLLKNIKREETTFSWKFNLKTLTSQVENIGEALPENLSFDKATLFIRGANSNYILQNDIDALSSAFPLMKLETIDGAGHWVHAEKPDEFLRVVRNFLKNN